MEVENEVLLKLAEALEALQTRKPNDRSPKDRLYQITMTDIEKVSAQVIAWDL